MDKEKLRQFLNELTKLQNKYGIYISASVEEEIDYSWDEEPYTSGFVPYLTFYDREGNEMSQNDVDFNEFMEMGD